MRKVGIIPIFLAILSVNIIGFAIMPQLEFTYENGGYKITYLFSEYRAEPGDVIFFNIEITSKVMNYDFRLWIDINEPLQVEKKVTESNLHYPELKDGDVKKDELKIRVPDSVQIGEIFSVTIRTQSHNNHRGTLNIRSPLDNPEFVFTSESSLEYSFHIKCEHYPKLNINSDRSIFNKGEISTYKITIKNLGKLKAQDIVIKVNFPKEIEIIEGNVVTVIEEIPSNSEKVISWNIKPKEKGNFNIRAILNASNHQEIIQDINLEVTSNMLIYFITVVLLLLGFIVIIFYLIFRT